MHRLGKWVRSRWRTRGIAFVEANFGHTVVARSSLVATIIVLFLAYSIGTTPSAPTPDPTTPAGAEQGYGDRVDGTSDSPEAGTETDPSSDGVKPVGLPLAGKTIVIDPGHGGWDPGALGVSGRTRESYNTLFIAKDVQALLERAGARVVMTRKTDTFISLDSRVAMANSSGADIFISIHNDSNPNASIRGVTTYYYTAQSRPLAETIQAALVTGLGARNVGVFQRSFAVVRGTWMPAVLVELGFLTNWTDEQLLADPAYRYRAATAIYKGVLDYFGKD